jgi:putative hydrolase of the HAD superfamily
VTFDALGTLIELDQPVARLRDSLLRRHGLELTVDRCTAAMRAEMGHYRARTNQATDAAALSRLRLECADVLADALAVGLDGPALLPCLTDAIAYRAYTDAAPALGRLREAGLRIAVVSNWDVSLHDALELTGLGTLVDAVLSSAEVGAEKPSRAIFEAAAVRLDVAAAGLLHVGDDPELDVDGARKAGLYAVLIDRAGGPARRSPRIAALTELPALLDLDRDG